MGVVFDRRILSATARCGSAEADLTLGFPSPGQRAPTSTTPAWTSSTVKNSGNDYCHGAQALRTAWMIRTVENYRIRKSGVVGEALRWATITGSIRCVRTAQTRARGFCLLF